MAWTMLGSFLTSIACSCLLVTAPLNMDKLPLCVQIFHQQQMKMKMTINSTIVDIHDVAMILHVSFFMYAAVNSLRAVICGIFKYIFFCVPPSNCIAKTILSYLHGGLASGNGITSMGMVHIINHQKTWDHLTPILYSAMSIFIGFSFDLLFSHGIVVSLPAFILSWQFSCKLLQMKQHLWHMTEKHMQDLRP